jgi:TolB-like protein
MAAANGNQSGAGEIILRIGVNLGDVMVEGADLYGDGVNIAARLEAIADPGGIIVSGTAFDHIKSKVKVGFDELGAQNLKNIAEPVRCYRVSSVPVVAVSASPAAATDRPSVAVLPFTNMSGDPEQEYFSDGITEDIITELARNRTLFVIARNSVSSSAAIRRYAAVRKALGARYVLEGSVRKAGGACARNRAVDRCRYSKPPWAER